MLDLLPGIVVAFREGLEAFLIIALLLQYLEKTSNRHLKLPVFAGLGSSVVFTTVIGVALAYMVKGLDNVEEFSELWETVMSLLATGLITTFIIWMIQHGRAMKQHVEAKAATNLTPWGIALVAFVLVAREGLEIVLFMFAGQYAPLAIGIGLVLAVIAAVIVAFSLFKIPLTYIFQLTLIYLIFQAGALLGSGVEELGEEAAEWLPLAVQILFTAGLLGYWYKYSQSQR
jgi:high-affinity iron transporter